VKPTDFGVQSYCFRHFKDNADVARMVRDIGVDKIEVCAVHADFDDVAGFEKVVATYRDAGVAIVSLGVETFNGDEAHARRRFECAKAAGARHVSCHFQAKTYQVAVPQVARLADEFGIDACIHCHGGYHFCGAPDTLSLLLDLGGDRFGLCLDTAWCMQIGPRQGKPVQWASERFKGRIKGVHYKDFVFDRDAQWHDVVVGTGNLDLPAFVKVLEDTRFDGYAVIEYEADVENPVPALTECVEAMRRATG